MELYHILFAVLLVLLAALAAVLGLAARDFAREWREHRKGLARRVEGRRPLDLREAYERHYQSTGAPFGRFERSWRSLADYMQIDPHLMRHEDRIDFLYVCSDVFWCDGELDLYCFALNHDPKMKWPIPVMTRDVTVGDLVTWALLLKQKSETVIVQR